MSVLVVDDNTTLLKKIVSSCIRANHNVRSAVSLAEAREHVAERPPRVLCLDLQLPDGHGLDYLAELRAQGHDFPVVIISGHASEEVRSRAAKLNVSSIMTKPFSLSDLRLLLGKLLADEAKAAVRTEPLAPGRLALAKRAYATRRVELERAATLVVGDYAPRAGDLVLARVDKLGQHRRIELTTGRRAELHAGNEIVVCYGNRYAPDQFEAEVPGDLSPCHLVAGGGIAARQLSKHSKMTGATRITPIGVLAYADGTPLNVDQYRIQPRCAPHSRPRITAVVGTSMNAGKTTAVAYAVLGMARQGLKVGAAKVTGTGAGCDAWQIGDAGASFMLDFTDCGYASTYQVPAAECETIMETLVAQLCDSGAEAILLEVADGILQGETRALVTSAAFKRLVDNVIFAAGDAMGAAAGVRWLQDRGLNVIGVSGALTASPLAMRECESLVDVPLLDLDTLGGGAWLPQGVAGARARSRAA